MTTVLNETIPFLLSVATKSDPFHHWNMWSIVQLLKAVQFAAVSLTEFWTIFNAVGLFLALIYSLVAWWPTPAGFAHRWRVDMWDMKYPRIPTNDSTQPHSTHWLRSHWGICCWEDLNWGIWYLGWNQDEFVINTTAWRKFHHLKYLLRVW